MPTDRLYPGDVVRVANPGSLGRIAMVLDDQDGEHAGFGDLQRHHNAVLVQRADGRTTIAPRGWCERIAYCENVRYTGGE